MTNKREGLITDLSHRKKRYRKTMNNITFCRSTSSLMPFTVQGAIILKHNTNYFIYQPSPLHPQCLACSINNIINNN